jgi:hypothetical protein
MPSALMTDLPSGTTSRHRSRAGSRRSTAITREFGAFQFVLRKRVSPPIVPVKTASRSLTMGRRGVPLARSCA